jgi:ankyrin repeat protein
MDCTRQQAATIMSQDNDLSNDVSVDTSSALLRAATIGQTRVVQELLQQPGIIINWQGPDSKSRTALHRACKNGHLEVVKLLVEHGASIEATDDKEMTPLLEAAGIERLDVVRFLEDNGSDINAVAADGRTILHFSAADNSVPDLEHFLQSPKLRHSLTTRTRNGRTVLHCAVEAGSVEATRFILQRSSRLEILSKTDDGYTCLHYAVISGEVRLFPLFEKSGICHYDQTSEGFAAIHFAAKSPDWWPLHNVLAYIDRTTHGNRNPFSYPNLIEPRAPIQCVNGTWSVDDFVSGRRLNVLTASGTLGKTAIQILLSADPFTFSQAIMVEDIARCTGIDLERPDREQKTPLVFLASRLSNESENEAICKAIRHLLHEGVDRNTQDIFGRTALHYLCNPVNFSQGIFRTISDLIGVETMGSKYSGSTARVDISDRSGTTPLQAFFASLEGTQNPIQATGIGIRMLRLSPKDELNRQSPDGNRFFNLAIKLKNDELIQELYNGGQINTQERDSTTERRSPLECESPICSFMSISEYIAMVQTSRNILP